MTWLVDAANGTREEHPTHLAAAMRAAELERRGVRAVAWEMDDEGWKGPESHRNGPLAASGVEMDHVTYPDVIQGAQNGETA